jgi:hypothetical protein
MLKWMKILGSFAIAAFILASCSSTAHIEKDKYADLSQYRTFAWLDNDRKGKSSRANDLVEQNVKDAVNKELGEVGWREVRNNPDVFLSYDILVERTTKTQNNPVYSQSYSRVYYNPLTRRWGRIFYPSQFLGYDNESYAVKEGTVTISMIDARMDKTIWQGWTTDEVNSTNMTKKEIRNSVKSIFKKFDIAKK